MLRPQIWFDQVPIRRCNPSFAFDSGHLGPCGCVCSTPPPPRQQREPQANRYLWSSTSAPPPGRTFPPAAAHDSAWSYAESQQKRSRLICVLPAPGDGRRFVFDLATGRTQISPASDGRQARPFLRPLSESIGIFVVCRAPFCPAVVRRNRRTTRPFAAAHARGYAKAPTLTAAGHAEPRRRNLARSSAGRTCERHRGDGRGSAALQLDAHPADTASLGQPVGRSIAWKPRQQALVIGGSVRQSLHNGCMRYGREHPPAYDPH